MKNSEITDPIFLQAVEAIDAGDLAILENLVTEHPRLLRDPLDRPSGDYFQNPYLLWFVADNPIRTEKLPVNIIAITAFLIDKIKSEAPESSQRQFDYALTLVSTGRIPRECEVQLPMMDLLIDAGAQPGNGLGALANNNIAAAEHLLKRGGNLTFATAVGLNRMEDVQRLATTASQQELLLALTVAAFYGNISMATYLLKAGAPVNGYPENNSGFHAHGTPLHQAVSSGSLEVVKLLIEAGADTSARDKIYDGTALGWAGFMAGDDSIDESSRVKFAAIVEYLSQGRHE